MLNLFSSSHLFRFYPPAICFLLFLPQAYKCRVTPFYDWSSGCQASSVNFTSSEPISFWPGSVRRRRRVVRPLSLLENWRLVCWAGDTPLSKETLCSSSRLIDTDPSSIIASLHTGPAVRRMSISMSILYFPRLHSHFARALHFFVGLFTIHLRL